MTYCPKCGTANRDGSRFCNECGEELGTQTHVECSHCGTVNPIQNVLCSECNGRLLPIVSSQPDAGATPTIKGLSLPTKNPPGEHDEEADAAPREPEDEVPAWLHELGASLSEEGGSTDADPLEDGGEVPDWLRDLRASLPEESEDEIEPAEEEERVPDWLAGPKPTAAEAESDSTSHEHVPETGADELEPEIESQVTEPEVQPQTPAPEALDAEIEADGEPPASRPAEDEVPGWLSRLVPAAAVARPGTEPSTSEEEETPAWLTRLVPGESADEAEPAGAATEAEDDEIPDWLADLQTASMEAETEATPAPESEEDKIPDWMADLQPEEEEEEAKVAPVAAESEEAEIPDWMAELQPEDEEEEAEVAPVAAESEEVEIPDWMAELQAAGEEAEAEVAPLAPEIEEEGETPDWVAELQAADEETETEVAAAPPIEIEEGEVPDWVAALRPADAEAETEAALSAIEIEEEEFPDRVAELEPPAEEPPLAEALVSPDEIEMEPREEEPAFKLPDEVEAVLGAAVPAWLAELQVEAPEAAQAIIEENLVDGELPDWLVRAEIEPDEALAPAEIPGWLLALKPTELRQEGEEAEAPAFDVGDWSEETGLLAGIKGTLPVEMLIAQPRAITAAEALDLTIEESPPARLFAEIVGRPPEAAPKEIVSPRAEVLPQVARWIIYAILIIVVSLPIIVGKPLLPRTIEPTAATVDLHSAIESVSSLDPVLVAFDYDPTSSGEMDVIARALLSHLMDQEARVVTVSLLPAGPATAQSMLDELTADRSGYAEGYGEQYANLGYLPGQAAGVRLLGLSVETALPRDFSGTPLSDLPVMQGLDSARDFALIVELAAAQDTLRWWIEQAGTPYGIPLAAGTSAAVVPIARPYYETESRQLVGLVGGVPDAATYEALASGQNSPTSSSAARLDSQLAGQIVFVLVILAGNVIYFSRRGTRRDR